LLPPHCLTCDAQVERQGSFCATCFSSLNLISAPFCARCGVPFAHEGEAERGEGGALLCAPCLSRAPGFAVGDHVSGMLGVQQYCALDPAGIRRAGLARIDPRIAPPVKWLNALGMPGMTAYFGLLDVGQPKAGETVVVSGAAGAVGQTVGQIARIKGCRVVGIAGGAAKCEFVVKELGFDACIDYKSGSVREGLKQHCPKGIDVYFDNVGGDILEYRETKLRSIADTGVFNEDAAATVLLDAITGWGLADEPLLKKRIAA
jgi:threonine dehydrogenase-like Zn-dependent dehydrogenase